LLDQQLASHPPLDTDQTILQLVAQSVGMSTDRFLGLAIFSRMSTREVMKALLKDDPRREYR